MPTTPLAKVVACRRSSRCSAPRRRTATALSSTHSPPEASVEIELTLTTPGTLDVASRLRADVDDIARIGVGTVTDGVLPRAALDAGARFFVTPGIVRTSAEPANEPACRSSWVRSRPPR
ncbi:hypothetical protein ACIGZH_25795 [Streptomyces sp. NPDC058319]|uniref:hypothetical protein n=1 Tax=unclassified Streptomyces TaxID=2593676 RepID=UPI0036E7A4D1